MLDDDDTGGTAGGRDPQAVGPHQPRRLGAAWVKALHTLAAVLSDQRRDRAAMAATLDVAIAAA